jgi:hypothetical protein
VVADKFVVGMITEFTLFFKDRSLVIHLLNKRTMYDGIALNILKGKGINTVYVETSEERELEACLTQGGSQKSQSLFPKIY